jgi:ABC-type antimicrobial peptide transport system permease subunit
VLAVLSGFFGALALLLAVIGLYGTMAYSVTQRRNEIGIRMALGAGNSRVLGMVVGEAGMLVAAGIVGGTLLALASTRVLAAFLYGVTPTDPATLGISAIMLATIAMAAAAAPAWRAARLDPMTALRED